MKKILLSLLLLLVGAAVFAQHPIGNDSLQLQTTANSNALFKSKGAIGSDSGFVNASYADTTAANRGKIKNYPGALIRTGNTIWLRNSTATMWIDIANSSSSLLTWEDVLNNQGAIPFDFSHNTDIGYKNFVMDNIGFLQLVSRGTTGDSIYSFFANTNAIGFGGGPNTGGSSVTSTADGTLRMDAGSNGSPNYFNQQLITKDYIKFSKTLNVGDWGLTPQNPKLIYPSDTLLTPPEFVYVSDADTIKKYPFAGSGSDIRDTAKLLQGTFILINNVDGIYQPNKPDVLIDVDTSKIATKQDITIITNSDTAIFIVDSISNSPPAGAVDGNDYLVGTSPTGLFAGHANDIAELVGGVYSFTDPVAQQQLIVDNSVTYATYQFNGTNWVQTSVLWRVGGNRAIGQNAFAGRVDKAPYTVRAWNKPVVRFDTTRDVKFYKFVGTPPGYYATFNTAGNIDTLPFRPLIAGANITITPGAVGDTISSTGGGGGGTPSLTSTQVAFGDGSNLMTSSSSLTYASDVFNVFRPALTITYEPGINIENNTASTSGVPVQISPSLRLRGNAWNLGGSGNDATAYWDIYTVPQSTFYDPSEPNARGTLTFKNNAIPTPVMTLSYNGNLTVTHLTAAGQVQGDYGAFNSVVGAAQLFGGLQYPSSQGTYRTTNAGSDLTPQLLIGAVSNGTGNPGFIIDRTTGLGFFAMNDESPTTRRIMRANIFVTDLANTAGSEAGGLGFATQTGGAVAAERMRITPTGNVLINTTTDVASSKLTVESTTQGALLPRMTKTQRDAISSPAQGLMVFVTDNGGYLSWYNSGWFKVSSVAD